MPKKYEFKSFEENINIPFQLKDLFKQEEFCEEMQKILSRNLFLFTIILSFHIYYTNNKEKMTELNDNNLPENILLE